MKLDEIEKLWSADSIIDETNLASASLEIPKLHSKYYQILLNEKRSLYLLIEKKERLSVLLEGYFLKTMTTQERIDAGLPDFLDKKILRTDVKNHIDRYPDIVQLNLKIGIQNDKVDFLKDIIKSLHNRSFIIKDAISWILFTNGERS